MIRPKLPVTARELTGKKLKKLRREGILPANIYGKDIQSIAVQLPSKNFEEIYKTVGETGLIDVEVNGELKPVLIKNVQTQPLSNTILHTDFYQVNLKEKITSMVPLEIVGTPKAVEENIGLLLTPISEIEIEALPTDLPEKIEVPVEHLANIDDQITVGDLKIPSSIEVKTDSEQVVAKIAELVSEEAKEVAAEMAAEQEAQQAAAEETKEEATEEKAEGETEAEGETKPQEEQKSDEAPKEEKKE